MGKPVLELSAVYYDPTKRKFSLSERLDQILSFHLHGGHATLYHIYALLFQLILKRPFLAGLLGALPTSFHLGISSWPTWLELVLVGAQVLGSEEEQLFFTLALFPG